MPENNIKDIKIRYGIIGNSEALNKAVERAYRLANTNLAVFIKGESGAGKEAIAKLCSLENEERDKSKFLTFNCAAISKDLIDSSLFGYVKGAFTGADKDTPGFFESADGGTLFLDEVGTLSPEAQDKLLRVLETGEYYRVGDTKVRKTNVRIVSATNLDLEAAIEDGRFRKDLYFRLNMNYPIVVPSLAERADDIPMLVSYFMREYVRQHPGCNMLRFTPDAIELLKRQPWTGNVRELREFTFRLIELEKNATELNALQVSDYLPARHLPAVQNSSAMSYEQLSAVIMQLFGEVRNLKEEVETLKKELESLQNGSRPAAPNISFISNDSEVTDAKVVKTPRSSKKSVTK